MPVEEWNTVTFTPAGPDSYGRFMRVRIFDCWMHEHDIRQAVSRAATDSDLAGRAGFSPGPRRDGLQHGFRGGQEGQGPHGSRVLIALTGPLSREIRVALNEEGRATAVEDFGGDEPTIGITVDGLQFTRLAGDGRCWLSVRSPSTTRATPPRANASWRN